MRKVEFKKYDVNTKAYIHGEGVFHSWGMALCENSDSVCNFTIAIVEQSDGSILNIFPEDLKFIK